MASLDFSGLDDLILSFEEIAELPDDVAAEMLEAEAKIIIPAQQAAAPKDTGTLASSIKSTGMKKDKSGNRHIFVYPHGIHGIKVSKKGSASSTKSRYKMKSKDGIASREVRNAEVGYVHEFGAPGRNIPARQWVRTANEQSAGAAADAAEKVYSDWLDKKGL